MLMDIHFWILMNFDCRPFFDGHRLGRFG
jgi:hypothetical protein